METQIFKIGDPARQRGEIAAAAGILRAGGLVAFPTETVYGLGADGLNERAVRRIFEAKGRPSDNPLILHVTGAGELERYCMEIPDCAYVLAKRFWPGPLTMVLKRRPIVPDATTAGLNSVAMRCPNHPVAQALLSAAGIPVAAPSGNLSGRPSPTRFSHVMEDRNGRIEGIVDGGDCSVGVESTIVDLTVRPPRLLRPGGVSLEALREVLGRVEVDEAVRGSMPEGEKPKSPGMKYRHYAPKAPVTVVCGAPEKTAAYIQRKAGTGSGVLCFD
ncbi:MAG: L-threonylcarbamoyladenylate synthase, partial [Oscillospiraceae bacterium]|nr:L-threonylcarbamoyladenylate synthase [Oscillospiraceae bacterium]